MWTQHAKAELRKETWCYHSPRNKSVLVQVSSIYQFLYCVMAEMKLVLVHAKTPFAKRPMGLCRRGQKSLECVRSSHVWTCGFHLSPNNNNNIMTSVVTWGLPSCRQFKYVTGTVLFLLGHNPGKSVPIFSPKDSQDRSHPRHSFPTSTMRQDTGMCTPRKKMSFFPHSFTFITSETGIKMYFNNLSSFTHGLTLPV